jgi:putative endonuclease
MAITYILRNNINKKFYIGSSHFDEPSERLREHNKGDVKSTKSARPWHVIHFEKFATYTEARKRENFLKTGVGRQWIYNEFRNK